MHTFLLYAIILQATKADTNKKKKKKAKGKQHPQVELLPLKNYTLSS